jgi:hypothetical protein
MKRIVTVAAILMLCSFNGNATSKKDGQLSFSLVQAGGWTKAKDGVWVGKDMKCYKLDAYGKMQISRDAKTWVAAPNAMWQDKSGKWLTLENKVLKQSTDKQSWSIVKDARWVGGNGKSYKFDADMSLLVMSGGAKPAVTKKKTK